jgi:hypothetical protein
MKLPNAHLAEAEQEKICGYLLNAAHPDNRGKAVFSRDWVSTPRTGERWPPLCGSWQ